MVSDVPFGVFLSGGIDSSTNVALMAELMDRPVETFSIGFSGEERYNEFQYARQIADRFRTNHHEVQIGVQDLIDFLPQLIHHQDEPIADPVCVPVYFVAKLAKQHGVTVCQVGEGSDELFCGYPLWNWFLSVARWNRPLRGVAASAAALGTRLCCEPPGSTMASRTSVCAAGRTGTPFSGVVPRPSSRRRRRRCSRRGSGNGWAGSPPTMW